MLMFCITPSIITGPGNRFIRSPNYSFFIRSSSSSLQVPLDEDNEKKLSPELRYSRPFPTIKSAKRVVLVRHGQSTWNAEGRIQGSSNFSVLTEKGEAQAETSRKMLIDDSFDICFASPLNRSKRTAEIIWGTRKEEILTDLDLREIDLYSFQGLLKHEGKEKFGEAFHEWQKNPANFSIDGNYPVRQLWERARNCWDKILFHESRSVLVVAHNAVNQALIATAMELGTEYFRVLLQSNCGVSVLDFTPRVDGLPPHVCLNRLNQTPGSPVAGGSSGGRKARKQIILVCHASSRSDFKASVPAVGDSPMDMLGIIQIGQGTYSSVYKARDLINKKVVALKRVRFDNLDRESVKFMAREILILRRLDHPNIIKLEGLVTSRTSSSLYLVFEYMEHDLTGLASLPGVKFTEPQVKCYMQQLLSGLDHCHSHGVLHRDIKGSNLLIDNNGILKIADFGLASFFEHHQSAPLTSHVVTLWYRPPELLLGATYYGVAVDLWSSGCILGELYAGKPIMPGRTEVEQLHKIFKLCGSPSEDYWKKSKLHKSTVFKPIQPYRRRLDETFKDFPDAAVGLMETLLAIDPAHRGTAGFALESEFFTIKPHACDPTSLPKYPPSKEIDAKLRDEEARRQGAGLKGHKADREMRGSRESRAIPAPDANAELATSLQKRGRSNPKTRSEQFNRHKDEVASGFPMDPPRVTQGLKEVRKEQMEQPPNRVSYSGPLVPGVGWTKAAKKYDDVSVVSTRTNLSSLSGLVASRTLTSEDPRDKYFPSHHIAADQPGRVSESFDKLGSSRNQDMKLQTQGISSSHQMENLRGSTKESILNGQGFKGKGNKIHFSGPLLVPSNNVDQMLKDHDRQIQEAARRARIEKTRVSNVQRQGLQITPNPMYVANHGAR